MMRKWFINLTVGKASDNDILIRCDISHIIFITKCSSLGHLKLFI